MRRTAAAACLLAVAACTGGGRAAPRPTTAPTALATPSPAGLPVALDRLGGFKSPVWVGTAPGDRDHLYLVTRAGSILRLSAAGVREAVVLDLHGEVSTGAEQGLLSMAFDPAYPRNRRLYVDYTNRDGDTRVVAYTVERGQALRPQVLLAVPQPYPNHNGGLVLFDRTGMLLVGMGDGGNAGDPRNRAQDLGSLLGKILRLDPRTGAPARGNPYPASPYVWALGLRNPWRFSFDTNGDFYLGDVGQKAVEELDVVPPPEQRGANYGWPVYEGRTPFRSRAALTPGGPTVYPALVYPHEQGACSITGGVVYRGRAIPALHGAYVYGDYCAGRLLAVRRTATGVTQPVDLGVRADGLQAFGVDGNGELLVLTVDRLSRLVPGA